MKIISRQSIIGFCGEIFSKISYRKLNACECMIVFDEKSTQTPLYLFIDRPEHRNSFEFEFSNLKNLIMHTHYDFMSKKLFYPLPLSLVWVGTPQFSQN